MDYTAAPLIFKINKALRYMALNGISRTLAKIDTQFRYTPAPYKTALRNPAGFASVTATVLLSCPIFRSPLVTEKSEPCRTYFNRGRMWIPGQLPTKTGITSKAQARFERAQQYA